MSGSEIEGLRQVRRKTRLTEIVQELAEGPCRDLSPGQIRNALNRTLEEVQPLGILRVKYLKILTLWVLCPAAAPEPAALARVLRGPGTQDDRMQAALALPPAPEPAPLSAAAR
ncbi:hypothetical protein FHY55_08615 [Oceanicola sp. D3]|uniref:hypothetical protein n=1 Tax=Oceanicola sp. D3 TaxID=2587163 RepID=UPI00111CF758|nr:hypothetical protein [Oceanicola sp. D3]QDC09299.1 hypothetical protein FHY55_08615 [Oceanicola sp. D3]